MHTRWRRLVRRTSIRASTITTPAKAAVLAECPEGNECDFSGPVGSCQTGRLRP